MKRFISFCTLHFALCTLLFAVPARRTPFQVTQPNGDTLTIRQVGDERWHAYFTEDGYLLKQNSRGYYCYAQWGKNYTDRHGMERREVKLTCRKAHDVAKRRKCEQRWLEKKGGKL